MCICSDYCWMCWPLFRDTHPAVCVCVCAHEHTRWETSDPSWPEPGPFPGGAEEKQQQKNQTSPSFRRLEMKMYPASHSSASRDPQASTAEKWPAENPGIMEKFVITHINHLFKPSLPPPRLLLPGSNAPPISFVVARQRAPQRCWC